MDTDKTSETPAQSPQADRMPAPHSAQHLLDYESPSIGPRSLTVGARLLSALCMTLGVTLTGIGLGASVTSMMEGWVEGPAVLFALFGIALCVLGTRLKREKLEG
jgi:hypothetical protein